MACEVPRPVETTFDTDDDGSDYGPDFTTEEQDLLDALLENVTAGKSGDVVSTAISTTETKAFSQTVEVGVALGVTDIEDQEHVVAGLHQSQERGAGGQDDSIKKGLGYWVG